MIIVITSLMASGKSTVAQLVAEGLARAVHLRGDTFRKMIVSGREEMCAAPSVEAVRQLKLRYQLTAQAAVTYHDAGFDVVVQDNYYGEMLQLFVGLLRPLALSVFVLCPDAQTIRRREAQRQKTGYCGFDVDTLYAGFMADLPHIGQWIDNSRQTPRETAEEILRHARAVGRPHFEGAAQDA